MAKETTPFTRIEREVNQIVRENWPVTFQTTYKSLHDLSLLMTTRFGLLLEKKAAGEISGNFDQERAVVKRLFSGLPQELIKRGADNFPQIHHNTRIQMNPLEMQIVAEAAIAAEKGEGIVPRDTDPRRTYLRFQQAFERSGGVMGQEVSELVNKTLRRS